jgi:hypothetical protein
LVAIEGPFQLTHSGSTGNRIFCRVQTRKNWICILIYLFPIRLILTKVLMVVFRLFFISMVWEKYINFRFQCWTTKVRVHVNICPNVLLSVMGKIWTTVPCRVHDKSANNNKHNKILNTSTKYLNLNIISKNYQVDALSRSSNFVNKKTILATHGSLLCWILPAVHISVSARQKLSFVWRNGQFGPVQIWQNGPK